MSIHTEQRIQAGDLLIKCLQIESAEKKIYRLKNFSDSEWLQIFNQAKGYGVTSLLYWQLNRFALINSIPEHIFQSIHQDYLKVASHNLLFFHELGKILEAFSHSGIPAIVLKGAYLSQQVYENIAVRTMGDLDLLVKIHDMEKTTHILQDLGFSPAWRFKIDQAIQKHLHIPPFYNPNGGVVEIHWSIVTPTSRAKVDLDGLWERAEPLSLKGVEALSLSNEDLLLHLCLHFCQHEFRLSIKHLYDIALALDIHKDLDWKQFKLRSIEWGINKCTYLTMRLANQILNAPIPHAILNELAPENINPEIEELARQRILQPTIENLVHPDMAGMWSASSLRDKMSLAFNLLFPYPEYIAKRYDLHPDSNKVYLYYLVRIFDLIRQYGRQAWMMARGDRSLRTIARQETAISDWLSSV